MMARSPAHYRAACLESKTPTSAMLIGSAVDRMCFGGKLIQYPGAVRRGKEWDAFQDKYKDHVIVSGSEFESARATADAVLSDPVAGPLLRAPGNEYQRVMQWEHSGLECAAGIAGGGGRGGFDILNERESTILDLKASADAEPEALMRHARRMCWNTQLRWYLYGAQALSIDATKAKLIVAETSGLAVTVLTLGPSILAQAAAQIALWIERLKACEAADSWPGYQQSEVEWDESEAGLVWE